MRSRIAFHVPLASIPPSREPSQARAVWNVQRASIPRQPETMPRTTVSCAVRVNIRVPLERRRIQRAFSVLWVRTRQREATMLRRTAMHVGPASTLIPRVALMRQTVYHVSAASIRAVREPAPQTHVIRVARAPFWQAQAACLRRTARHASLANILHPPAQARLHHARAASRASTPR